MKHTAGPWHVGVGNGEGSVFANEGRMRLEEAGATLYPICEVFDLDGDRETNARLIAAAPELLEACKEALHGLYVEHAENCDDPECSYLQTYNKLRAAIAKGGKA